MATYTYTATGPNASIEITTEDTLRTYNFGGADRTGYRIIGISGSINGDTITGLLSQAPTSGNPTRGDTNGTGGNTVGNYNNIFWSAANQGQSGYSYFGLDFQGLGFTTTGNDYKLRSFQNSNQLSFNNGGTGGNFTTISTNAPCYVTGTRILTARGEVAVEDLTVGDLAVTASGEARAIRWIGHRTLKCRSRADLLPVRIAADAFGEGRPARDLLVSPGHAVCVDVLGEVLIPAIRLVNGTTVAQVEVAEVTYWHVELESHDILLAEGLPAESYLDMGNRAFFEGAGFGLGPDTAAGRTTADFCRPFHEEGALVEAVRARLQARAEALGWSLVEAPLADLHLVVDGQTVRPDTDGLVARFILPADARDVRLVSEVSVPAHVRPGTSDDRRLGVCLASLSLDDGLTGLRAIALDDDRLESGLHPLDTDGAAHWRWTDGAAPLPASLWEGCRGTVFLRVTLAAPALPRWVGPREAAGIVDLAERRRRA